LRLFNLKEAVNKKTGGMQIDGEFGAPGSRPCARMRGAKSGGRR